MKVLVACEESQEVCKAFRARGHEAYSCDIQEPSGGHPEWHILGDALEAIRGGHHPYNGWTDAQYRQVGHADRAPALHLYIKCRGAALMERACIAVGSRDEGDSRSRPIHAPMVV